MNLFQSFKDFVHPENPMVAQNSSESQESWFVKLPRFAELPKTVKNNVNISGC